MPKTTDSKALNPPGIPAEPLERKLFRARIPGIRQYPFKMDEFDCRVDALMVEKHSEGNPISYIDAQADVRREFIDEAIASLMDCKGYSFEKAEELVMLDMSRTVPSNDKIDKRALDKLTNSILKGIHK